MKVLPFIPLLVLVAACSNDPDHPAPAPQEQGEKITLTANLGGDPQTRIGYDDTGSGGVKLTWSKGDQFIAFPGSWIEGDSPTPGLFTLIGDGGSASGSFTGTIPGEPWTTLFYPANNLFKGSGGDDDFGYGLYATTIGQTQTGNGSLAHLSDYNFMIAALYNAEDTFIDFAPNTTLMCFNATLENYNADTDGALTKLTLSLEKTPEPGEHQFMNVTSVYNVVSDASNSVDLLLRDVTLGNDNTLKASMMIINTSLFDVPATNNLIVSVTCANGAVYRYTPPASAKRYICGQRYTATCTLTKTVEASSYLVFDNNTTASASFSGGDGTSIDTPYLISNASDLKKLVDEYATFDNKYFKLTADICVKADVWTPIGNLYPEPFQGKFDGNGHTISGKLTGDAQAFGFFGAINVYAEVRNLHIIAEVNSTYQSDTGYDYYYIGAVVGHIPPTCKVIGCTNSGTISAAATQCNGGGAMGGITGYLSGYMDNCVNRGKVIGKLNIDGEYYFSAGGVVGSFCSTMGSYSLLNCRNYGEVTVDVDESATNKQPVYLGGIVGTASFTEGVARFIDCTNYGTIKAVWNNVKGSSAGLVGQLAVKRSDCSFTMHNCVNRGTVEPATGTTVNRRNGGMIGFFQFDSSEGAICTIADCCADTGSGLDYLCGKAVNGKNAAIDYTLKECTEGHIRRDNDKPFVKVE